MLAMDQTQTLSVGSEPWRHCSGKFHVTRYFNASHCLGYYIHNDCISELVYGLVFKPPPEVDSFMEPVSLRDALRKQATSLSIRVTLMRVLAQYIERLHAVNWLHKGLRSQNIIFFYERTFIIFLGRSSPDLMILVLSVTSASMSEAPPSKPPDDFYRQTGAQGGKRDEAQAQRYRKGLNFKKRHNIYSLGVVLTEIAYW
ncbi:hypothetical protein F5Y15DRAFT_378116 [Xylariaceae sp. FL0016]|nr:hypothetical protein F5Y15DRAFT_378116 [Xylariaceae sp. FL0016]